MNDTTIQMIAQAIIANTKVIQSLIDALPHETKAAVAEVVNPTPAPVAAPAPVVAPVVAPAPVAPPVAVPAAPVMPAPTVFAAPAPVAPAASVPFHDGRGLVDYVMAVYKQIGPQRGAGIQNVLTSLGVSNINDVRPDQYPTFYTAIEALKG
jgi:hypothetical protein